MKQIKYAVFVTMGILLISSLGYSQDNSDRSVDDGAVGTEKVETKHEESNNGEVKNEEGNSVIIEYPTERVKTKTEQPTEEEIRKEAGYESETVTNSSESVDTETTKKRHKEKKHQGENGKSESKGNKDKNNDSPYDHDQGKGNDWKVEDGGKYKDSNSDTWINNKDKKYDDNSAPDGVKKEKKEKKNKKTKTNKKK
jgi:hypothetical protein